jgi:hypothetical protein
MEVGACLEKERMGEDERLGSGSGSGSRFKGLVVVVVVVVEE